MADENYAYSGRDSGSIGPIFFGLAVIGIAAGGYYLLNSIGSSQFQAGIAESASIQQGVSQAGTQAFQPSPSSNVSQSVSFSAPKLPANASIEVSEVQPQTMVEYPLEYPGSTDACGIPLVSVKGEASRFVSAEIYFDNITKSYYLLLTADVSNENLSKDYLLGFDNKTGLIDAVFSKCPEIQKSKLVLSVRHEKPEVIGLDTLPECEEQIFEPSPSPSGTASQEPVGEISFSPSGALYSYDENSNNLLFPPVFPLRNPLSKPFPQVRSDPLNFFSTFAGKMYSSTCANQGIQVVAAARKYVYKNPKNFLDQKPPAGTFKNSGITKGKTCAWFVTNVYKDAGFGSIYGLKVKAQDLKDYRPDNSKLLRNIPDLILGDIVLMHTYDRKDGLPITHVGIYSGNGMMVHSRSMGVVEEPVFTFINQDKSQRAYYGAVRVLPGCVT